MNAPSQSYVPGTATRFASWLAGSLILIAVMAAVAARLPVEAKPLGLYLIGWGALSGWCTGQLALRAGVPFRRTVLVVSWIMIAGGLIGGTLESYRIKVTPLRLQALKDRAAELQDPLSGPTQTLLSGDNSKDTPEVRAAREQLRTMERRRAEMLQAIEERREFDLQFRGYLSRRVSTLGNWPQPWPTVFWWAEVILGSTLGSWLAWRSISRPYCWTCLSWDNAKLVVTLGPPLTTPIMAVLEIPDSIRVDSDAARVTVKFIGCACPERLSAIRCQLQQPAHSLQGWSIANPSLQKRQEILQLMASESPLH